MRPRRRRIVRIVRIVVWLATGIAALVLLVAVALAFLIGTQTGTRFLFARLGALIPGTFEVRSAEVGSGGGATVAATGPAAPVAGATAAAGAAAAAAAAASGAGTPTTTAAAAAPTVIDEIDVATTDIGNLVHLDRLAVRSAVLRAEVTGTVQPRGDYPVDLAMRWEMHPPGPPATAPVLGNGTLKVSL